MAIAFRAVAANGQIGGTGLAVAKPAGTVEGDVMVAAIYSAQGTAVTPPAGWTALASGSSAGSGTVGTAYVATFHKTAGASEPASYTFTFGGDPGYTGGTIGTYYESDAGTPPPVVGAGSAAGFYSSDNKVVAPAVNTTQSNSMVVAVGYMGAFSGALSALTEPAGMIERYDATFENFRLGMFDVVQASTGSTGSKTITATNGNSATVRMAGLFAIAPGNAAPNAPTGLSPSGVTIDRDATQRFSWTFSDPDAGDSQSAYDLRYRPSGSTTWTVVSGTTPNTFHDFAAGTFAAGDYEWQVRTYDAQGLVGPYSSSAFFTAAAAPATPSITDPVNGQTVSTEDHEVRWSTPSQDAYQVRTVADSAGVPDATVVHTDTGTLVSSTARSRTVTFATNNRDEHVQVRIRVNGLWSAWASVKVTVSYTPPQTPRITATGDDGAGLVRVVVDAPPLPPGGPTFTRASTAHLDGVEVASGVPRYPYGRNLLTRGQSRATEAAHLSDVEVTGATAEVLPGGGARLTRSGTAQMTAHAVDNSTTDNTYADVSPGLTYQATATVRATSGRSFLMYIQWRDGNNAVLGTTGGPTLATDGSEQTYAMAATAPAGAVWANTYWRLLAGDAGDTLDILRSQVEQGSAATPWRPGGPSAVLIEEGTTNLLTAATANGGEDGTVGGWAGRSGGEALASSTAQAWQGTRSIAGTFDDTSDGAYAGFSGTAGTTYTGTAYVKAPAGMLIRAYLYDDVSLFQAGVQVTATGGWDRVSVTAALGAASTTHRLYVRCDGGTFGTVYIDGAQVEAKGYATSWHPGGATRAGDTLALPGPTDLPIVGNGGTGTIEVDAVVGEPHTASARLFEFDRSIGGRNGLTVYRSAPGTWGMYMLNDAGTARQSLVSGVTDGLHRFAVKWDGAGVHLYIDGVRVATRTETDALPSGFGARWLGSYTSATGLQLNRPILGVRTSDRARTDAELADWTAPLTADDDTTYLLRFEGDLAYATEYGEFDGTENYPNPTATRIYRTGPDGEILIAVTTPDATYLDRAAGARVAYTYRAVSVGDNGTTATSTATAPVTLDLSGVWLHPATDPDTARHYLANGDGGSSRRTVEKALRRFAGRALPVVEFGEGREEEVRATLSLTDHDAWEYLVGLEDVIVLYRDAAGRRLFGVVDLADASAFYGRDVDVTVSAVDYDEAVAP